MNTIARLVLGWVLLSLLTSCATEGSAPQARYLTPGTTPVCLLICTVVVTNSEAGQYPALRQINEVSGFTKTTTQSPTVTTTTQ